MKTNSGIQLPGFAGFVRPKLKSIAPIMMVEWIAGLTGLYGAYLLSNNDIGSKWGWAAFLASNVFWIIYGVRKQAYGLLFMQIGYTYTSVQGIIKWIL